MKPKHYRVAGTCSKDFLIAMERKLQDRFIEMGWDVLEAFGLGHGLKLNTLEGKS